MVGYHTASVAWRCSSYLQVSDLLCWVINLNDISRMVMTDAINSELKAFADLVTEGKIKPLVDSVYEFDNVLPAYERILSKRATGKLVVKVDPLVT